MPPQLALFLTLAFVCYLFRRDCREKPNVTGALWIPTVWMLIITTRAVTTWLKMFGISVGGHSLEEGSIIDALVYFGLITAGIKVLVQRRVSLSIVLRKNVWISVYLFYGLLTITWSDLPLVACKRWSKDLGQPIMVLILLTEPNFEAALSAFLKRCAYVVVPVSILFIKYYPEWGRGYSTWSGQAFNTGITENKNSLGWDCLILAFFFVWHLLVTIHKERTKSRRREILLCLGFLGMIWWLFAIADSKTPLVALFLGLAIMLLLGLRWVNRRLIGTYILPTAALVIIVVQTTGIYEIALEILGRNASLTERTPLWAELRNWGGQNPILGTGFESFWLGERRERIWEILGWEANEAHNGYLETYLNLGLVGLTLLSCVIAATYFKTYRALVSDFDFGRFRFSFLFAILIYNWTEAAFHGLHPIWLMFFLITIEYPKEGSKRTLPPIEDVLENLETAPNEAALRPC